MKKTFFLYLLFTFTFLFGCGTVDVMGEKTPEEFVDKAFSNFQEGRNFNFSFLFKSQGQENIEIAGKGVYYKKPLRMKLDINYEKANKKTRVLQYIEEKENYYEIYEKHKNQWTKVKFSPEEILELIQFNPEKLIILLKENLIGYEVLDNEKQLKKFKIKLSNNIYEKALQKLPYPQSIEEFGDIEAFLWIDRKTLNITRISLDIEENLKKLGNYLEELDKYPQEIIDLLTSLNIYLEYNITKINNAEKYQLPEELKKIE